MNQALQLRNPQAAISFNNEEVGDLLEDIAESVRGLSPGDTGRVCRRSWEVPLVDRFWKFLSSTPDAGKDISGKTDLILDPELIRSLGILGFTYTGHRAWGRAGIVVGKVGDLPASIYLGEVYDDNIHAIMPKNLADLPAIWAFVSSDEFAPEVRKFNQKLAATVSAVTRIPFSLSYWQKVADEKYPNGLPKPFSSDPTQWLFSGHPVSAEQPLHVAVARLVGYQWPRQTGSSFPDCPALGPDGLEPLADEDGIVCLSPIRGEVAAADRLRALLASAFGDEWSNAKERELLLETAVANDARKAAADLGDWLRQSFFAEHCKLFQSRPFIWQIWDGNPYGFSALVNYHKLAAPKGQGRKTLELLTYTYLGDWIDRQKLDQAEGVNGADDRLAAALDLQGQLKKILEGESPYDIFIRWKPLHQQAIGWDPDINDGVRLNIRPFLNAQLHKGGKTSAGILRAKPGTIKWAKDRGKEPMRSKDDFPWFWGWDENSPAMATDFGALVPGAPPAGDSFDGNRWNDLHYSRAAKEAARARHRGEG